jgi:hypothetical protein
MSTIDQLARVDSLSAGDVLVVYSRAQGDARGASLTTLLEYIQDSNAANDGYVTQYAAPNATGFSVTLVSPINGQATNIWLILTPIAGYAAGTLVLPAVDTCLDHQEILVNTTQAVTTLTISNGGATVVGAPTTLAANAFFKLKFDAVLKTWYRVG